MPQHIHVYCRRPVVEPDWLATAVGDPDYLAAAEGAELDEEAMSEATRELRIEPNGDITYAGAARPIQVAHYAEAAMVREIVEEACEHLDDGAPDDLATLLAATVEVVSFELGFEQAEGIGGVIAEQIARAISFATEGIVNFYGEEWRVVEGGRERG